MKQDSQRHSSFSARYPHITQHPPLHRFTSTSVVSVALWVLLGCILLAHPTPVFAQETATETTTETTTDPEASPLQVELEALIVNVVETKDGPQERFLLAREVFPEQILEYRLTLTNISNDVLPAGVNAKGPVPPSTTYVAGTATPSSALATLSFSFDGETFAPAPLFRTETDSEGNDVEVEVSPAEYTVTRWTVNEPLAPGQVLQFNYRVEVQ